MSVSEELCGLALKAGFIRARFAERPGGIRALVCALPVLPGARAEVPKGCGEIAAFARKNYYERAVRRLKSVAKYARAVYGGEKSDYGIYCNSRIKEKQIAVDCGLGRIGKHGLIVTPEAGAAVVIAVLDLPKTMSSDISTDGPLPGPSSCENCPGRCVTSCPSGAISADGVDMTLCIQWYASGHGKAVPDAVRKNWGCRFYGCEECSSACPSSVKNDFVEPAFFGDGKKECERFVDVGAVAKMDDDSIRAFFRGTALGFSWLGPEALRRNARLAGGSPLPCDLE